MVRFNHPPDTPLALVMSLPKDEAMVGLVPDSLFVPLPGAFACGLLWWQIRLVKHRRSVRCARQRSKSEIPGSGLMSREFRSYCVLNSADRHKY
jgi:hypothetical protein